MSQTQNHLTICATDYEGNLNPKEGLLYLNGGEPLGPVYIQIGAPARECEECGGKTKLGWYTADQDGEDYLCSNCVEFIPYTGGYEPEDADRGSLPGQAMVMGTLLGALLWVFLVIPIASQAIHLLSHLGR